MMLLADSDSAALFEQVLQYTVIGLTKGSLFALIALGYTMVYGIVELINFAHGDLFMLGSFVGLTVLTEVGLTESGGDPARVALAIFGCVIVCGLFCAGLNMAVDRVVYVPLRNAPKLAPLVSAIGVSFIFMNIGLFRGGPQIVDFPNLLGNDIVYTGHFMEGSEGVSLKRKDLLVIGVTVPLMVALTLFVKYAPLGKAMRATAQNPTAAKLMGINTERVIAATFGIGGALAGAASVVYGLTINTVGYQIGFQNGLYAFTAAVLGGIGNIPGAVLGSLIIGLITSYGSVLAGDRWTNALVFGVLIVILVFRPSGLLGSRVREKV